uniref:RAB, member RAS oncogene family like 6 n=1 Tax=Neogobius melanostomus TaxID=47308 RepID=A0A8C6ST79_9GOBI
MMFDITKQWTFNYIMRELPKVPTHVPVCVLGNHRDMGEHRVILPDDIRELIAGLNRPMGASYIHYAESSMKNGFGLKYLHRFFNIPFLQLQRETLLRQLETNQLDMDATLEELCVQQETEDQNYEIFLENLETRKGYGSPGPANGQSPSSGSQSPIVLRAARPQAAPAPAPLNSRPYLPDPASVAKRPAPLCPCRPGAAASCGLCCCCCAVVSGVASPPQRPGYRPSLPSTPRALLPPRPRNEASSRVGSAHLLSLKAPLQLQTSPPPRCAPRRSKAWMILCRTSGWTRAS